jgi:hypothetical protein
LEEAVGFILYKENGLHRAPIHVPSRELYLNINTNNAEQQRVAQLK